MSNSTQHWLNQQVKDLFEHFLLYYQDGEQVMWQAFNQHCQTLDYCPALSELFKRYLQYKHDLQTLDGEPIQQADDIAQRLEQLKELQQHWFNQAERQALFDDELAWDEQALERLRIAQDPNLSPEQKQWSLQQHLAQLPEDQRRALQPTFNLQQLKQLQQQGQADYNHYAAEFGDQAAERLMALQQRQNAWQQRINDYRQQQARLQQQITDSSELANATQALQTRLFTNNERKRLKVLLGN